MSTNSLSSRLQRKLREFCVARKGNVAITFGLATIPIVCVVGAAVDYSHANAVKVSLQSALDSAALMMQRESGTDTADELQKNADKYFRKLFTRTDTTNIKVTARYFPDDGTRVVIDASADMPTTFVGIMSDNFKTITVRSSATAKWGNTRLRVALALDNTGSMSAFGKMDALKVATNNLIDQLKNAAAKDGDVYVSIIPFSKDVNVGNENFEANWIYWDNDAKSDNESWDAKNGKCSDGKSRPRSVCTAQRSGTNGTCSISGNTNQDDCEDAGVCSKPEYTSRRKCRDNDGDWTKAVWTGAPETWTPNAHSTWNGCVMDRDKSPTAYNVTNTTPTVGPPAEALFPAEQFGSCSESILKPTYDWTALHDKVAAMTPVGNTNTTIGLMHGWQSLTGGDPYDPPAVDTSDGIPTQKVIIFLTDGENTQDRWDDSSTVENIDDRMKTACANAKADKVTIFTVLVMEGNESLLQSCASPDDALPRGPKYFKLTSADQIVTAFDAIGTNLAQLFLSK